MEPLPPLVAAAVRALGSALRVAIIRELRSGPNSISGLAAQLGVREMTVADNVRTLAGEGVLAPVDPTARRRGPTPFLYELAPERVHELVDELDHYATGRRRRRPTGAGTTQRRGS